jgi:hypothetical protein
LRIVNGLLLRWRDLAAAVGDRDPMERQKAGARPTFRVDAKSIVTRSTSDQYFRDQYFATTGPLK